MVSPSLREGVWEMAESASEKAASRWETTTPVGYNPNGFYTQASDKKGHSAKITVKVPVNVAGEIASAVASGRIGEYKTAQDFLRDAVIHRLHSIQPLLDDPDLERKITMWTINNEALRARQQREEYAEMWQAIQEHVTHLTNTRQDKKLRTYLNDLLDKTDIAIPEEFRADYLSELNTRLRTIGK